MKWNLFVGSLVVTIGLCSQSFGFELLDRMLGVGACDPCGTCTPCKSTCDQKGDPCGKDACQKKCGGGLLDGLKCRPCQKGDGKDCGDGKDACQKGCGGLFGGNGCCQKGCDGKDGGKDACQKGCGGLFGGRSCCQKGCDGKDGGKDACQKTGCRRPLLSFGNGCCQKGDGGKCGDSKCGSAQKGCCGPSLLERIFACNSSKGKGCCQKGDDGKGACQKGCGGLFGGRSCCQKGDGGKGGNGKCGCGADAKVKVDAEPEAEEEAPAPPAPVVDPSAFLKSQRRVIHASTNLVR